jgi:hypothetical protein
MNELDDLLPPIQNGENQKPTYRKFQSALPTDVYVALELDAAKRNITFYKLVQSLLTLYANGRLQVKPNAPKPKQDFMSQVQNEGNGAYRP